MNAYTGLDPCVHCGFCLPACPTYEVTADEADSPRGRIVLMRALARGEIPPDEPDAARHLDRCLGCRGCESVCPSGVLFGPALEQTRADLLSLRPLPLAVRAALWALARPGRQRWLWALSRLLRRTRIPEMLARSAGPGAPRIAWLLAMVASTRPPAPTRRPIPGGTATTWAPAPPNADAQVALLRGCVMEGLFSHVHDATVTALAANGVTACEVPAQVCCGALAAHAGDSVLARELAVANVEAFDAAAPGSIIVTNSAGCGAMLKAYGEHLAGTPLEARARAMASRVRDISEVLADRGPRAGTRAVSLKVAYDAPCHLIHAQKVDAAPRAVLSAVPGLSVVPLDGAERCCGSAGLYSLMEPELSAEVLAQKLAAISASGADVVATGNPGCVMQIGAGALLAGIPIEVRHPVELLAWSYGA